MQPLVSLVICTYNSASYLPKVLDAIGRQDYSPMEIIIIDDNSADGTVRLAGRYKRKMKVRRFLIHIKGRSEQKGAASSTNIGFRLAKGEIVCSIDSDAVIDKGWAKAVVEKFKDPKLGSIAGYIRTANRENFWASIAGLELEDRYDRIAGKFVDHVSTCNTAYRADLIRKVGGFSEQMYYGYDVDMSYRITKAGYKILLLKKIGCDHYWKESFTSYLRQQFNVAYGRLAIISAHPKRYLGDKVSGGKLILQVPLTLLAIVLLFIIPEVGIAVLVALMLFQIPQTARIIRRAKSCRFAILPFILILRNLVWAYAFLKFGIKEPGNALRIITR